MKKEAVGGIKGTSKIDWHSMSEDTRIKLKRLYPGFQVFGVPATTLSHDLPIIAQLPLSVSPLKLMIPYWRLLICSKPRDFIACWTWKLRLPVWQ